MIYVALLRGINVGGKNKVDMTELRAAFADAGMTSVTTYINSGNVIFSSRARNTGRLASRLEKAIADHFGFQIRVLVRDFDNIRDVVAAMPADWVSDTITRCDVMFLWDEVDRPETLELLSIKPAVDELIRVPGALIWKVDKANVGRSGMTKLVGTPLYKQMTIRNSNTARKLLELMEVPAGSGAQPGKARPH